MDLSKSLSILLQDAHRLSNTTQTLLENDHALELHPEQKNPTISTSPYARTKQSMALKFKELKINMQEMVFQKDEQKNENKKRKNFKKSLDHLLLIGACASLLSTFNLSHMQIKSILRKETKEYFYTLTHECLNKWSIWKIQHVCDQFRKGYENIIQEKYGKYSKRRERASRNGSTVD